MSSEKAEKNKESQKKKGSAFSLILIIFGGILVIVAGIMLLRNYKDHQYSVNVYKEANETYVKTGDTGSVDAIDKDQPYVWYEACIVDFDSLKAVNDDVIGWIYFENEDISYPILYSGDDSTYLRTTMDMVHATAGSIFLEGGNSPDFNDSHSIIYGHLMRNLSMFGKLKYYRDDETYYEDHQYFQIITPEASYRYQIFAYNETPVDSYVYTIPYSAEDPEFQDFIDQLFADSLRTTDIPVTVDDKIVTLSTCTGSGTYDHRLVVNAVRVDTHEWSSEEE